MQGLNSSQGGNQGSKQSGLSWSSPQGTQGASASPLLGGTKLAAQPAVAPKPTATTSTSRSRPMPEGTTTRTAGVFLAGMVVGALLMWGWSALTPSTTVPNNTNTTGSNTNITGGNTATNNSNSGAAVSSTSSAVSNTGEIDVATQAAGSQVMVTDATVSAPTWLVVYELANGVPVRALGATMFFPEYNGKGGIITLVRPTESNKTYFVGQSLDTGDHTFTPHKNKEVTDSNGSMVGTTFKTQ